MGRIEKTVFISYRRTNAPWALAIFQYLTQHGYDVFFDFNGIASGDFERVILDNITARAHFLVLLTPSALERCHEPGDWLRREIETAMDAQRNVVPLLLEGFDFGTLAHTNQLTGRLADLRRYQALRVPSEYFVEAMGRLRDRFLNVPLDGVLHPASSSAQRAAREQQDAAATAPAVEDRELTAQKWFERGIEAVSIDEQLQCFGEAIRLKPEYPYAFAYRGLAQRKAGDLHAAKRDFDHAVRLNPNFVPGIVFRGLARRDTGDLDGALRDFDLLLRLQPDNAWAYRVRGNMHFAKEAATPAILDYDQSIKLAPGNSDTFVDRAFARYSGGDLEGAITDCNEAIRLDPTAVDAFLYRAIALHSKGELTAAIRDYTVVIGLDPSNSSVLELRGFARQGDGDLDGALQDYDEALRLKPNSADVLRKRGFARQASGDADGGLRDHAEADRLERESD